MPARARSPAAPTADPWLAAHHQRAALTRPDGLKQPIKGRALAAPPPQHLAPLHGRLPVALAQGRSCVHRIRTERTPGPTAMPTPRPAGTLPGGADPRRGTRLVCLADRVAAAGGTLFSTSPPGDGTAITTTLPLGLRAGARGCLGAERRALGPSAGS
jgi:hypothetical protein